MMGVIRTCLPAGTGETMRKILTLFVITALVLTAGCSDDVTEPVTVSFTVDLTVTDPSGDPVAGLEAKLHVFLPPEVMPYAAKPRAVVPFAVPVTSAVTLIAYDLDGKVVKKLYEGIALAGRHQVSLGSDEEGNPLLGTHLYRCEMVASVEGAEQYRGETFLTLYTAIDQEQRPVLGITDDQGRIRYNRRLEFPYLYNPGPQMRVDETAVVKGTFEFSDKVEITLIHPGLGLHSDHEVVIGQGRNTVNLVWDAKLAGKPRDWAGPPGLGAGVIGKGSIPAPIDKYSLGPGYPNPFN